MLAGQRGLGSTQFREHIVVLTRARLAVADEVEQAQTLYDNTRLPKPLTLRQTRALISGMPFNAHLGLRVAAVHRDGVTLECALREEMRNAMGVLHGGVTATLADAAVGVALLRHFGGQRQATTVALKVNYFRPVASGRVRARAHLIRVGAAISVGRVDLWDSANRLAGAALVTYVLLPEVRGAGSERSRGRK